MLPVLADGLQRKPALADGLGMLGGAPRANEETHQLEMRAVASVTQICSFLRDPLSLHPALRLPGLPTCALFACKGQVVIAGNVIPLALLMPDHHHTVLPGGKEVVRLVRAPVLKLL